MSEQGTPVKKSKPWRWRSAARSEPVTPGGSRAGALRCPLGLAVLVHELGVLGPDLLDELPVGRGLDVLVELRAIVADETHALDDHVVDEPLVAALHHPVIDGDLRLPLEGVL